MEVTKDIIFDSNLFKNEKVNLTYKGYLFKANSTDVSIVYGYGDSWQETTEQPMKRTLEGFKAELSIKDYDTFNFCFKNSYDEYDNNYNQNFTAKILPKIEVSQEENNIELVEESEATKEAKPSINEKADLLTDIMNEYTLYFDNRQEFNVNKFVSDIVDEIIDSSDAPTSIEDGIVNVTELDESISNFVNVELENTPEPIKVEEALDIDKEAELIEVNDADIEEVTADNDISFEEIESNIVSDLSNNIDQISKEIEESSIPSIEEIKEIDKSINGFEAYAPLEVEVEEENLIEDYIDDIKQFNVSHITESVIKETIQKVQSDDYVPVSEEESLVSYDDNKFVVSARKLTLFYKIQKRIRLFFYKALRLIPGLFSKDYDNNENR